MKKIAPHAMSGMKIRLQVGDYVTVVVTNDGDMVAMRVDKSEYGDASVLLKAGNYPVAVKCYAGWRLLWSRFDVNSSGYKVGDSFVRDSIRPYFTSITVADLAEDAATAFLPNEASRVTVTQEIYAPLEGTTNYDYYGGVELRKRYHRLNRLCSLGLLVNANYAEDGSECIVSLQRPLGRGSAVSLKTSGNYTTSTSGPTELDSYMSLLPAVQSFFLSPSVDGIDRICEVIGNADRVYGYLIALSFCMNIANGAMAEAKRIHFSVCPDPYNGGIVVKDSGEIVKTRVDRNTQIPSPASFRFKVKRSESIEAELGINPLSFILVNQAGGMFDLFHRSVDGISDVSIPGLKLTTYQTVDCDVSWEFHPVHPSSGYLYEIAKASVLDYSLDTVYVNHRAMIAPYSYELAFYRFTTSSVVVFGGLRYPYSLVGSLAIDQTLPEYLSEGGLDYDKSVEDKSQEFVASNPGIAFISEQGKVLRIGESGFSGNGGRVEIYYNWLDASAFTTVIRDPVLDSAVEGTNLFFMPFSREPLRPNRQDVKSLAIFISIDEISDYYTPDDGFELFRQDMEELQQEVNLFTGDSLKIVILDRASLVTPNSQDNTCPTDDTDAPGDPLADVSPVVNLQENGMPTGDRYIEIFEQSANGRPINRLIVVLDSSGSMRGSVLYNPINDALDELIAYVDEEYPGIQTEINNISNEAWAFNANYYISRAEPSDNIVLISIINESTPYGPSTAPNYGLFKSDITSLKNTLAAPPCVAASVVNIDVPSLWPDTGLSDAVAPFSDTTNESGIDRPEYITIATELRLFGDIEINGQTYDRDSRWPPIIDEYGSSADYAYALYDTSRSARSAVDCEDDADRFISLMGSGSILSQSGRTKKAGFDDERWAKAAAAAIREINLINANA